MSAVIYIYVIRISEGVLFVLAVSINVYHEKLFFFFSRTVLVSLTDSDIFCNCVHFGEKKKEKRISMFRSSRFVWASFTGEIRICCNCLPFVCHFSLLSKIACS